MKKIKAYIKRPEKPPYSTYVSNTLRALQNNVDGLIEVVSLAPGLCIICNEEGRILDLPYNCTVNGIDFFGTILFVGTVGENFTDVPLEWGIFKRMFEIENARGIKHG